jgi:cysteine desulfurase / selenocysteine lyase
MSTTAAAGATIGSSTPDSRFPIPDSRRSEFPLLVNQPGLHYLDSAATAQKPRAVLDAIRDFYERANANPHRGAYALSVDATERLHSARARIARFFGAGDDPDRLIFTRGTTESINLVATAWGRANVRAGDEIVITGMEHHANFVPWQQLALATGATLRIVEPTAEQRLDLEQLRETVNPRTKVVAFAHVSNAVGTIHPVREIAALVRERSDALVVCDGAQGAPHLVVDVDHLGVDLYAFSGHKMGGPMGIGGLVGRRAVLEAMPPYQFGGDMIEFVHDAHSTWAPLPHRLEAGTPNAADAVGLAAAVEWLDDVGMANVRAHELALLERASAALADVPGLHVYGPPPAERSGVVSFTMAGPSGDVHPHDLATILDGEGVCIRAGHHCAQPLMRRLGVAATARASFWVYSDEADVAALVRGLRRAAEIFG